jgi:hypothetical protein
MKRLLLDYIHTESVDFSAIGDIWRQRDRQPLHPQLP